MPTEQSGRPVPINRTHPQPPQLPLLAALFVKFRFHLNFALSVPSGCVDGATSRYRLRAEPAGTGHEECESKPDRCYWTDGWNRHRDWLPGTCYYNKGLVIYYLSAHILTLLAERQPYLLREKVKRTRISSPCPVKKDVGSLLASVCFE